MFPFLLVVPGLIGLALFHDKLGSASADGWDGTKVLPELVKLLPTGVLGVVLGAFLAGVMSNLDSYVNSASTLVVSDLYKPFVRKNADDRHYLLVGRILIVAFLAFGGLASFAIKEQFNSVFTAFQTFLSFFQGALLALLLLGMLTKRTTAWGGLAGLLIGVGTAAVLHNQLAGDSAFLWVAWWSFVAALAGTILVSMFTPRHSEDHLRGLVWSLPKNNEPPTP